MDDVSDKIRIVDQGGAVAPGPEEDRRICAIDCTNESTSRTPSVPVTREEIAILRAFLSAEIDAIIYAENLLPKD